MLKEAVVENFTNVPEFIANGADRIELCDNLAVGGTTVSPGVAVITIKYCHDKNVKVMSMIRPRGGNFNYSKEEIEMMKKDLVHLKELGTDGVVFGCLNDTGWIDEEAMLTLLDLAKGLEVTFHMAFDQISSENQFKAIDWLVKNGVSRILTHGGPSNTNIEDNLGRLKEYIDYADGRIIILPGGGITNKNLDLIISALNVSEAHGTKIVG
ncbi:copper homeostasis protein CutC [Robertmurraya yapensis]|uniref:PF03932 family protein CutC n=1 Tax=Bacillus yapensis TaxID=2492960 RepID=A0A431VS29_9BACI|nr:copper homeostasis protein CutC [Bacillus yapensis]RTR25951.1 copper homeostasis protein CutC [Bacillus yapensis]TKS93530.1 copper homeostasis protein CutC [Bacillus yapensis]